MNNIIILAMFGVFGLINLAAVIFAYTIGLRTGKAFSEQKELPPVTPKEVKEEREIKRLITDEEFKQKKKVAEEVADIVEAMDIQSMYEGVSDGE